MFTIYTITNLVNGKIYVGQSVNWTKRWKGHTHSAFVRKEDHPLYHSMRKHGLDKFICEPLLQVKTKEDADYQERMWILLLGAHVSKHGYVCTWGGNGWTGPSDEMRKKKSESAKSVFAADITRHAKYRSDIDTNELIRLYRDEEWTQKQIAERFSCSPQLVASRMRKAGIIVGKGRHKPGYKLSEETCRKMGNGSRRGNKSPVFLPIDLEKASRLYTEGNSLKQVGAILGCSGTCIKNKLCEIGFVLRPSNNVKRAP